MNQETPRPRPAHPAPAGALPPGRAHRTIRGAAQWLSATTSRIAGDAHSWMQAVHWVLEAALHPRFCTTTLRVARVLAELNPCRPGVAYLMRRLQLGERMVQYHLAALRETGLLVYVAKGGTAAWTARHGLGVRARHSPGIRRGPRTAHQGLRAGPPGRRHRRSRPPPHRGPGPESILDPGPHAPQAAAPLHPNAGG
ncbi:hypothetical protein GCM10020000_75220 [Streptomyces olivoverticillatus]